jgi:hypothetical protein
MAKLKRDRPDPRTRIVQLRVTESEARILHDIAAANGWSVAELIREALDQWMRRRKGRKAP